MVCRHERKQLRWIRQVQVSAPGSVGSAAAHDVAPTARERLIAALADRPQTVAQLAKTFGLAQPTVLEHVRRALRDGLLVEVEVPVAERRFAAERYYAPTVPVIRAPDRELLESACQALADDIAASLAMHRADLEAAFAMTMLAREGWSFADLGPYLNETIRRLMHQGDAATPQYRPLPAHGLAWVEEAADFALDLAEETVTQAERQEETA